MNAYVLKILIGMEIGVKTLDVQVDKFGMGQNVFVKMDYILMEQFASNVSMVKFGNKAQKLVDVREDIDGMEIFAKDGKLVLEAEFITRHFNNVFVKMDFFGMDLLV